MEPLAQELLEEEMEVEAEDDMSPLDYYTELHGTPDGFHKQFDDEGGK